MLGLMAMIALAIGLAGCGSEDPASAQSCTFHSDCPSGTVCNFESKCATVECDFCKDDPNLVCIDGACSLPECSTDDECDTAAGETCNNGACSDGTGNNGTGEDCQSNADCEEGETCNLQNQCVPDGGDGCTSSDECGEGEYCNQDSGDCEAGDCYDSTECGQGETCDENNTCVSGGGDCGGGCPTGQTCNTSTNQCEEDTTDPCGGGCPTGQVCNTDTDQCEPEQQCDPACGADEVCDVTSGNCVPNDCPVGTPSPQDCANDPVYNKFDPDGCFCAQCLSDSDCDTAAGETCNPNGECMVCETSCTAQQGGGNPCPSADEYCVANCCVECIGNADCASGEVCVDGSCGAPPDCSVDPTVCTGGMVCNQSTGQCETPQSGGSCTSDADCQQGQFCDPTSGSCQSLTNPGGGGTCDPACPDPNSCFGGMICTCPTDALPFPDPTICPAGQICFFGMCMAF